jgi:hypothetical protein
MLVKFNGAPSGDYRIDILGPDGYIGPDASVLLLTTVIAVDTISPLVGSVLGGTLVTITGGHFGTVATDNPVKIGDNYCLVESTSDAEIKCRVFVDTTTVVSEALVLVFAKTSEETICNEPNDCMFSIQASSTTVSGADSAFDAATNAI